MIDYLDRGTCGIIFSWVGSTLKVTWPDVLVATVLCIIANCEYLLLRPVRPVMASEGQTLI